MKKILSSLGYGLLITIFTIIMVITLFKLVGNHTLDAPKNYWPLLVLWLIFSVMVWLSKSIINSKYY